VLRQESGNTGADGCRDGDVMSFWKKNLEAIKQMDIQLFEGLEQARQAEPAPDWIWTEAARDSTEILGVERDGKRVLLNSSYRPREEAVKFAGKIQLTENSITLFVGFGNGMIVSEILGKLNSEALLFIYEPSSALFCYALEHFDVAELLSDQRVALFVEGINETALGNNLSYALDNINVGVTVMEAHPKYTELFSDQYEKMQKVFKDCRKSALTNLSTVLERNRLMTENAVANLYFLLRSKLSTDLVGKFPEDMPAILVAGGPSLEKNYQVLHQAKGKALIMAMDRTARFLLDHDIVPDIFCSLDFAKNPALFEDERLKDIPFLYIPDLSHRVMNMVNGNKLIYGTGDYKFYDWLIQEYGKTPMELPLGGSVATFAFGFARYMGFRRTILIGQDLSLKDGQIYAGGWQTGRPEDEKDYIRVPGNVEEYVMTRGDFYVYLTWFKQAVKEAEGIMEVINATEGGARIEGTRVMTLQEAVDTYCTKEYDIAAIFDQQSFIVPPEKRQEAYGLLQGKQEEFLRLKKKAEEAMELARRCGVLNERGDRGKEFKEKNKRLSNITKLFDQDVAASLINKYVEHLMLQQDMDLYVTKDDDQEELSRLYHKLEYDYRMVYENVDGLVASYEAMLTRVKEAVCPETQGEA
jgi:hypothetical protein